MGLGFSKTVDQTEESFSRDNAAVIPLHVNGSNSGRRQSKQTAIKRKKDDDEDQQETAPSTSPSKISPVKPSPKSASKKVKKEETVDAKPSKVVLSFSGFKNSSESKFNKVLKKNLAQQALTYSHVILGEESQEDRGKFH